MILSGSHGTILAQKHLHMHAKSSIEVAPLLERDMLAPLPSAQSSHAHVKNIANLNSAKVSRGLSGL